MRSRLGWGVCVSQVAKTMPRVSSASLAWKTLQLWGRRMAALWGLVRLAVGQPGYIALSWGVLQGIRSVMLVGKVSGP